MYCIKNKEIKLKFLIEIPFIYVYGQMPVLRNFSYKKRTIQPRIEIQWDFFWRKVSTHWKTRARLIFFSLCRFNEANINAITFDHFLFSCCDWLWKFKRIRKRSNACTLCIHRSFFYLLRLVLIRQWTHHSMLFRFNIISKMKKRKNYHSFVFLFLLLLHSQMASLCRVCENAYSYVYDVSS